MGGVCGSSSNFNCLIASTVVDACCRGVKQLPRRTNLCAVENLRLRTFQRLLRYRESACCELGMGEKNWISARCSTTLQFDSGAAIFKEDF